jgi:pyridinium-3,5-biscarboxylic acid mononucleotide sulfurtransferase
MANDLERKRAALFARLEPLGSGLVALSGGVDSSLLLAMAAAHVHGPVAAAVAVTPLHPDAGSAREAASRLGVTLHELEIPVLDDVEIRKNPAHRCYLCKRMIFSRLQAFARERGLLPILDGSNADDLREFRPGRRALFELGISSPLAEAGLTKDDVRALAAAMGLPESTRASDTCAATRFPYGAELTADAIERVRRAELALAREACGPTRVRAHGDLARVEVEPRAIPSLAEPGARERICRALREAGFRYVALDLVGYRSGAMDEALSDAERRAAEGGGTVSGPA